MQNRIPITTILSGADTAMQAIKSLHDSEVQVRACSSIMGSGSRLDSDS